MKKLITVLCLLPLLASCERMPELHLYDSADVDYTLPLIDLNLEVYWDYELSYGVYYDWRAEWFYGWDEADKQLFGELGYTEPTVFNLRRYYTGEAPYTPHAYALSDKVYGNTFHGRYEWGFWDLLVWNDINPIDGVQSLNFDETTTLDQVTAYTNQSMRTTRYSAPRYTHAFYEPELLFAAYEQAIHIDPALDGFEYDEERNVYVKKLNMVLEPITYIYLTQVILHNNRGRIVSTDGSANLSGMARSVVLNTGIAGNDPITVYYNVRMKKDLDKEGENVDIVGGRVITFGMCNINANRINRRADVLDEQHHYMDVTMQFNNGMDSTIVFDVTEQVRKRYKGGVITVELDVDTVPIPQRSGGSAFNAVVEDFKEETHEFEM